MKNEQILDVLELELTQHRAFGDSGYIQEQLRVCFERRLGKVSAHMPAAGRLLDALVSADGDARMGVIGDTVVRCAIQHALSQLTTGTPYGLPLQECEEIFRAATAHLDSGGAAGPTGAALVNRVGPEPHHGRIWSEAYADDVFSRSLRQVVRDNYGEFLYAPAPDEVAMLVKGARLLGELLPSLSRAALSHVRLVAIFPKVGKWTGRSSSSQFKIGGTIFLSRAGLPNPWWVAEHLFHESLHHKLYDFRHGHSLLEPSYARRDAPRVCALWNEPSKSHNWDIHRAVAAFHVYVHLAVLATVAELRASELETIYGPMQGGMIRSRKAIERARYLGEKLQESCWQEIGYAGKHFMEWLISILDALDRSPPPRGSCIHLLLDRYQSEARRVEAILQKASAEGGAGTYVALPGRMAELVKDEVRVVCDVLSSMNATNALERFEQAVAPYLEDGQGAAFFQVRRVIHHTMTDLSRDGYTLRGEPSERAAPDADAMVRRMIESSSDRLDAILAEYGVNVAALLPVANMRF